MEIRRQPQQQFSHQMKEEPGEADSEQTLPGASQTGESGVLEQWHARESFEAGRADHAVVVFGDALATEKLPALRTARHRLTRGVVEASLVGECGHDGESSRSPNVAGFCQGWLAPRRGDSLAETVGNLLWRQLALRLGNERADSIQHPSGAADPAQ